MENSIKEILSELLNLNGYIAVNKTLIKKLGLDEAVILCELISEYKLYDNNGELENDEFFSTQEMLEDSTGINAYNQRKALAKLQDLGILSITKKGLPAKNYFKLDFLKISEFLTTSRLNRARLVVKPVHINNNLIINNNSINTNNTKKKDKYSKCIDVIEEYTENRELRETLTLYLKLRLEMKEKPIFVNQWKGLLNKLSKLTSDDLEKITIVQQSTDRGYASFYPLKSFNKDTYHQKVISEQYTDEEIKELDKLSKEREKRGQRTKF